MKIVALTQRVEVNEAHAEKRDALDQRWWQFLNSCHIIPLIIPNDVSLAKELLKTVPIQGVFLTGGSRAPERDEVELFLVEYATKNCMPLFGVCHGMQVIQKYFGIPLKKIDNHVSPQQEILIDGKSTVVNSYHDYGTFETNQNLQVWAKAPDGVIKAVRHIKLPIVGIMWHPERLYPYAERDINLVKYFFHENTP